MQCSDIDRYVDSFIDQEFAEPERLEFETHLSSCPGCRRLVQEQASLKALVRVAAPHPRAPGALLQRVQQGLDQADRELAVAPPQRAVPLWHRDLLRVWAPMALMAVCVLGLLPWQRDESPVISEAVARHQRNLPLEITGDPRAVLSWFDGRVPFAMRAPRLPPDASLRGGRLISLGDRDAAYLLYDRQGNKISVFVFDAFGMPFRAPRRQVIGSHEVYLDGTRGYNVAVFRDRGLGYAITGNIDEPDLIRLISSAVNGR